MEQLSILNVVSFATLQGGKVPFRFVFTVNLFISEGHLVSICVSYSVIRKRIIVRIAVGFGLK